MPHTATSQEDRQAAIREILARGPAGTQRSIVSELLARGFDATQSSVSRDLKDLGAIKTGAGYELTGGAPAAGDEFGGVAGLVHDLAAAGPHLLVVRTAIGAAQQVALAIDRSGWTESVGSIAGDDTVFVATAGAASQRNLIRKVARATRA